MTDPRIRPRTGTRPEPRPHPRTGTRSEPGPGPRTGTRAVSRRDALRRGLAVAAGAGLAGVLAGDAPLRRPEPAGVLRLATGEKAGLHAAFGRLLAREVEARLPRLRCRVLTTAASVDNLRLLDAGRADLALVLTDTARTAAEGAAPFGRPIGLRALGRVYETYLQCAVRADSAVREVAQLAGHTVWLGAAGSGGAELGERLLRAAGLTPGTDVRVRHLPMTAVAGRVRSGAVDALLVVGGAPIPVLSRLTAAPGLRFLPLADLLPRLGGSQGLAAAGLDQVTLPQGAYDGVNGIATIGVSNLLVCRPGLSPGLTEALTRILVQSSGSLVPAHVVGTQFLDVRSLISTGTIALHPGAVAAYRSLHG
ncbi:TAXI family TRAP transporter solute-binding subunit [Streptomyces sp. NPDC059785]|uniref:TAXI family TRAP transporter solute-binding subunit n=1 Tax=unclassified Streptomyces TaxID=2593676 RepID=UPI00365C9C27